MSPMWHMHLIGEKKTMFNNIKLNWGKLIKMEAEIPKLENYEIDKQKDNVMK